MSENYLNGQGASEVKTDSVAHVVEHDLKARGVSGDLDFNYDREFKVDDEYIATLPDLQNGASIRGANIKLERVGIHNFRLPIKFRRRDSSDCIELETSVTGTVSLEATKKGINMSRIMRSFYEQKDVAFQSGGFTTDALQAILRAYKKELESFEANIMLSFSYPMPQISLRSGLEGWQYYDVTLEMSIDSNDKIQKLIHFDFVYSSACPCSFELAEHARSSRHKAVVSHSQRSVARISVKYEKMIWIEDMQEICLNALQTETQVMVKREDEQAFAEMNGAYLKFVEDAVRLLFEGLDNEPKILDFKIICSHLESLHSHDAIAVTAKGIPGGFTTDVTVNEFRTLLK